MLQFLKSAGWGTVLLFCFAGWGWSVHLIVCLCRRRRSTALPLLGVAASLGVSSLIAVGGLLNLFHLASAGILNLLIIAGLAALALLLPFYIRQRRKERAVESLAPASLWDRLAWTFCWLLVLFTFAASFCYVSASYDDSRGYFPLAQAMLQTGTIDRQPFSERRMLALGGDTFLLALSHADRSFQGGYIKDPGIAMVILALVTAGLTRRMNARGAIPALSVAILACVPLPMVNSTSMVMIVALLLAMVDLLIAAVQANPPDAGTWVEVGLLAAGLISLKTNVASMVGIFLMGVGCWILVRARFDFRRLVPPLGGMIGGAFLVPWMISSWICSGTALFPLLGSGFHHGLYSNFSLASVHLSVLFKILDSYFRLCVALLIVWTIARGWRRGEASFIAGLLGVCALVSAAILDIRLDGYMIYRFQFPFLAAAIICFCCTLSGRDLSARFAKMASIAMLLLLAGTTAAVQIHKPGGALILNLERIRHATMDFSASAQQNPQAVEDSNDVFRVEPPGLANRYRAVQQLVPAGRSVLLLVSHGHLWDFNRNPGFIADNVATVGPPPGFPLDSFDLMARYLRDHSIDYVLLTNTQDSQSRKVALDSAQTAVDKDYIEHDLLFRNLIDGCPPSCIIFDSAGFKLLDLHRAVGH